MTQRPATASGATPYRRRRPERTLLYRTVQTHFEAWLALRRSECDDADAVAGYVEREFRRYLECGILAHGFARARCAQCGHDFLIAFSCKGAAFNAHLHFHCVVVHGVFAPTPIGRAVFHPATAIDELAIATVQATIRRRLLATFVRRALLPPDDAQTMAQWAHDGDFSVNGSVRIAPLTAPGVNACCAIAPAHRSPWSDCMSSVSNASSTILPHRAPSAAR